MIPKNFLNSTLYKNSFYIMLTSVVSAGFGFLFWVLAAKLYTDTDVGIATAIISSITLLILLSRAGMDQSVIRFFPLNDKNRIMYTSLAVTTGCTLLLGLIFIAGIPVWSPDLGVLSGFAPMYLIFLVANSVTALVGVSFMALRRSEYYFLQNLLLGSRIVFLFPLIFLGAIGIFASFGISFLITLIFSLCFVKKLGIKIQGFSVQFLRDSFHYSAGNYIVTILNSASPLILPIMILNLLDAGSAAIFYIVYSIVSLLFIVPAAFSVSMFVEGSHGEDLMGVIKHGTAAIFALLVPAILVLWYISGPLLGLIGPTYENGVGLLHILAISSLFSAVFTIYTSIRRIDRNIFQLTAVSLLNFVLLISFSYYSILRWGLIGVGYAWISAYVLTSLIAIGLLWRPSKGNFLRGLRSR